MDAPTILAVQLDGHPGDILPWIRQLAIDLVPTLPPQRVLIVGPPTLRTTVLAPYETVALYIAPHTVGAGAQLPVTNYPVAVAVTHVPLRPTRLSLELRVWLSSPATLDAVLRHIIGYFAHTQVVLSGVASSLLTQRGAPPLACNLWLAAHLHLIDRDDSDPPGPDLREELYLSWLEQYRSLRGEYPSDPRRSFRAALTACRQRAKRAAGGAKTKRPGR